MTIPLDIILRLLLAISLGGIIGLEREASHKPAGLRTHILICISAAMMMILRQLLLAGRPGADRRPAPGGRGGDHGHGLHRGGDDHPVAGNGPRADHRLDPLDRARPGAGRRRAAAISSPSSFRSWCWRRSCSSEGSRRRISKKGLYHYQVKIKERPDILVNLRKLIFHLGLKLVELNLRKDGDVFNVTLAFSSSEEKERQFNQSLLDMGDVLEIKID